MSSSSGGFNHASPAARGVDSPSPFRRLQHYRLVLNEIGRSLSDFRDTKEMVTAVRDAIVAHGDAYDKAEILHRDISSGNILITATGGQAHTERTVSTSPTIRTLLGTWQFMSARLLVVPTPGQQPAIPDRADDLESFFYVLVWIALRYTKHGFFKSALTDMLHAAFDHHYLEPCRSRERRSFSFINVPLRELIKTLAETFAVRYEKPPDEREIAKYNMILQQQAASRTPLEKLLSEQLIAESPVRKYMARQDDLKGYSWMGSELTTALQNSGWNEHGDHVKRDLSTPPPTQPMVPKTEGGADPISDDPFC
ncbi:hypothetical protein BU17DRAFT_104127 [Hysterangium stoloniferum]|nr:hypothetical protein BU17DRAFT_104127 [Hysterangium stoloniferum]